MACWLIISSETDQEVSAIHVQLRELLSLQSNTIMMDLLTTRSLLAMNFEYFAASSSAGSTFVSAENITESVSHLCPSALYHS